MKPFPYAKLARAFAPRPAFTVEALGHRFIPYGEVEMICRSCGFVIWKANDEAGACDAVRQLGGAVCPNAIATEARRAETPQSGSVHEGADPEGIAQEVRS